MKIAIFVTNHQHGSCYDYSTPIILFLKFIYF